MLRRAALLLCCVLAARGQSFTHRGFFETRNSLYPQTAANDSGRAVSEKLLRWEASWKPRPWLQLNAAFDARFDSHRQFERALRLDFADRGLQRPALSARRLSAIVHKGGLTLEAGRQFIRWGKADILNPTDRFAPKDFLNVINSDFLGVTALRATYERGGDTFDAVWQPVFTPSRGPLLNQRWVGLPPEMSGIPITDLGSRFPGRGNLGARWNHIGGGYELSLSLFDGFNHLPLFDAGLRLAPRPSVAIQRYFARMRMYGADAAVPLRWFTLKGETAWFTSSTRTADEYALYVIQAERQHGEWVFTGGYAGEAVTKNRLQAGFAPDRGLARSFLGRASYNLDANRTVAFETAVRQDARGMYLKTEYSQALGAHLRFTGAFTLLRGQQDDFLGQYNRNSNFQLVLRYSF
ncbi:MAG: hypothetical protein HY858_07650 [Candidatus Solibacter usitatus]|nr:hypothetical protein [Candidatus Solibacter usitatus]